MKTRIEKITTFNIRYTDFNGNIEDWRKMYFDLLIWKNATGLDVYLDMKTINNNEHYVELITDTNKEWIVKNLLQSMDLVFTVVRSKAMIIEVDLQDDMNPKGHDEKGYYEVTNAFVEYV